jgi:hypothetical protein
MMQDFWQSSGYNTLQRNDHGWLRVTPEYIRWLLMRPELAPINTSGPNENVLHAALLTDPLMVLDASRLATIEDDDTRENYVLFLRFRQSLLDCVTLERFYLRIFRKGAIDLPPLFIDLVTQAIVRGMLAGCEDPYQLRAGEMFFRRQRISTEGGQILAADAETIQQFADTGGFGSIGRLLSQQGTPLREMHMDVMSHSNAQLYLLRENRHAWLLDITQGRNGIEALANLLARWVKHFLGTEVAVLPLPRVEDEAWRWHIGLDVESTAILNDLYENRDVDEDRRKRLVSLFRLTFANPADMRADIAGKPVYLGMAVTHDQQFKLKPQNLLLNLPLAASAS